ncbi:hypothetical protein FDF40_04595 [Clostridium sporogenes]|uniref:hypothetical protein n=2 Tax=Bacillota TaxID=1239 RepID=UPI0013D8B6CE|nr:hypothetical protein [Clostridium sporogenes]NFT30748.1 hypothetical protein [Clostridium sporogenes]GIN25567.1 hypothetical protein J31TS2_21470 [Bacillus licheniformis]GIN29694.1 hypothetical protein J2TS5_17330 [Bacillus licheniformis]
MMAKRKTKLQKSTAILNNSKITQWCYVNTDNEFRFMDKIFTISNKVEEYKVHNKAGTIDDYTNEAYMEEILVSIDDDGRLHFYNQNYDLIDNKFVKVKE